VIEFGVYRGHALVTGPVPPTSTLLVVAGLARSEFLAEISAVAVLD
jgi:2-iminobutanoate/2-iminopropanoate deaminase